jgi:hypothetical protein
MSRENNLITISSIDFDKPFVVIFGEYDAVKSYHKRINYIQINNNMYVDRVGEDETTNIGLMFHHLDELHDKLTELSIYHDKYIEVKFHFIACGKMCTLLQRLISFDMESEVDYYGIMALHTPDYYELNNRKIVEKEYLTDVVEFRKSDFKELQCEDVVICNNSEETYHQIVYALKDRDDKMIHVVDLAECNFVEYFLSLLKC